MDTHHAVDTRKWEYFRTLFTADVIADYPHGVFEGMDAWLGNFVPFHDECLWTLHAMTNHVIGEDANGVWASCYGFIEWIHRDTPDFVNRTRALYRDRLREQDGAWVIARRNLRILMGGPAVPIPEGVSVPHSVLDLIDVS